MSVFFRKSICFAWLLLIAVVIAGCSGSAPVEDRTADRPPYHVIKRGENLFRIAWRYGLDYRDVASWNRLKSPDLILAGQKLRLDPPTGGRVASSTQRSSGQTAKTTSSKRSRSRSKQTLSKAPEAGNWQWPAQGKIVKSFNPSVPGGKGIQISGKPGQDVKVVSGGKIVYKGSGLRGYGRLIIAKHSDNLLSAYGYLGRILVEEGDSVRKGQVIAELDNVGNSRPVLHFEIRKNGKPVNPLRYLPG